MKPKTPKQKAERLTPAAPVLKTPRREVNWDGERKKRERFEDRVVGALEGMAQAFAGIAEGVKAHGKGTARQAKATEAMCDKAVAMIEKMEKAGAFGGRSNADVDPDAHPFRERSLDDIDDVVARSLREDLEEQKRERVKQEHPDVRDSDYKGGDPDVIDADYEKKDGEPPLDPT